MGGFLLACFVILAWNQTAQAMSSTVNSPDAPYLEHLRAVDFQPVFIMGEHRSGTTVLYKTLSMTNCFNFVQAYHIIKYDEILFNHFNHLEDQAIQALREQFAALNIRDREFDAITVDPNLPEEYGFIIKNAGYGDFLNQDSLPLFIEACQKIQLVSAPLKPLLLKNPWCFPHFMYIKQVLPDAKFIFIHRHPIHTINSQLKTIRSVLVQGNKYTSLISKRYRQIFDNPFRRLFYLFLYSKYFKFGLNRAIQKNVQSTQYFLSNIASLSQVDFISIKYEDLCNAPQATIEHILSFLQLKSEVSLPYESLLQPRAITLLPEVCNNYRRIGQALQPYLAYHGYEE